jgi:hypothetical protein
MYTEFRGLITSGSALKMCDGHLLIASTYRQKCRTIKFKLWGVRREYARVTDCNMKKLYFNRNIVVFHH